MVFVLCVRSDKRASRNQETTPLLGNAPNRINSRSSDRNSISGNPSQDDRQAT